MTVDSIMAASSVDHYERMQKLQEIQHEREHQRLLLEEQLNAYLRSNDRLSKLKASKLQSYWKKICEDERKSRVRNEQLLRDFSRLESYITAMSKKTDRLRTLKNDYEAHIERLYPKWKETLEQQYMFNHLPQGIPSGTPSQQSYISPNIPPNQVPSYPQQPMSQQLMQPAPGIFSSAQGVSQQLPVYGNYGFPGQPVAAPHGLQEQGPTGVAPMRPPEMHTQPEKLQPIREASSEASTSGGTSQRTETQQSSVQPSGYSTSSDTYSREPEKMPTYQLQSHGSQDAQKTRVKPVPSKRSPRVSQKTSPPVKEVTQPTRMVITSESDEDDTKPSEEEIRKAEIAAIKETPPPPPPEFTDQEESILSFSEDVSDFDISAHLPGTDINETFKLEEKISSPRRASGTDLSNAYLPRDEPPRQPSPRVVSKIPLTREPSRSNSVTSDTTGPSVTSHGFWVLVKAVEDDLRECLSPHKIYRSQKCSPTIKTEIVKSANEGHTLEHIDPAAVSMVMLNELPLLIHDMPAGCLLPDTALSTKQTNVTASNIKSYMYSSSLSFWEKLLGHFSKLMEHSVMKPAEIASTFAPVLISSDSVMENEAVQVLQSILQNMQRESFLSDSSSTLQSTPMSSPIRQQPGSRNTVAAASSRNTSKVEDIDLDSEDGDSFFENKVKLTETAAYQKMIGSTQMSQSKNEFDDDNDDDDDVSALEKTEGDEDIDEIENEARLTPTSGTSEGKKKSRNLLSSLNYADEEEDKIENKLSSSWRSGHVTSPDESSLISTPSATPRSPAYIPTAMTDTGNQSKSESFAKRSAAFWDGSDLDESDSIALPMATGTIGSTQKTVQEEEEKDDFDFYD